MLHLIKRRPIILSDCNHVSISLLQVVDALRPVPLNLQTLKATNLDKFEIDLSLVKTDIGVIALNFGRIISIVIGVCKVALYQLTLASHGVAHDDQLDARATMVRHHLLPW